MAVILFFLFFLPPSFSNSDDETVIREKLFNQAKCWNAGDIDCFMEDYWHDDRLMYIGKNGVTYGWKNTLDNYKAKYPSKKEMGQLTFDIIQIDKISNSYFFMAGKWHLNREIGNIFGHFTLIWKKIDDEWVIVADHSS